MNRRFLFLLAWVSESDGNCGEVNDVNSQDDLRHQFDLGNTAVMAVDILLPDYGSRTEDIAAALGYAKAFDANYTAYDTVSMIEEIDLDTELRFFWLCDVVRYAPIIRVF